MSEDERQDGERVETAIVLQGAIADLQRAAQLLQEHGIEAAIGSPEGPSCGHSSGLWLEVAREDAQAALRIFDQDWRSGLDEEQMAALDAASRIVIDPDAAETTCPACMTTFATGPAQCPECGLTIG